MGLRCADRFLDDPKEDGSMDGGGDGVRNNYVSGAMTVVHSWKKSSNEGIFSSGCENPYSPFLSSESPYR